LVAAIPASAAFSTADVTSFWLVRAVTVMIVTTVYVIATMSFSGILEPGLMPALVPIGLLAGSSAVVTLLLIAALAGNKIQGLGMARGLGMLIAGLPCLPWFIHSGWNPAFGVLPSCWAAKTFWVASDHGTWWPFLLGGVVHNVAIAWLSSLPRQEHVVPLSENRVNNSRLTFRNVYGEPLRQRPKT
jgi:fluoroquinolone transport system permease protein